MSEIFKKNEELKAIVLAKRMMKHSISMANNQNRFSLVNAIQDDARNIVRNLLMANHMHTGDVEQLHQRLQYQLEANGTNHYASANASSGPKVKPCKVKITSVYKSGKHPYHCRSVNDAGAFIGGVYGWVNDRAEVYDKSIIEISKNPADVTLALQDNTKMTEAMFMQSCRDRIIDFAAKVADENTPVSREEFNKIFKVHTKYEKFLDEHHMTNGETDIAFRIINESYEKHMKNHSFIEDIRGYTG